MRRLTLVVCLIALGSARAESSHAPAGRVIWDIPEALRLIRTAAEIQVFPVTFTYEPVRAGSGKLATPHGDYKHLRTLGGDAGRKVVRLLGQENHWFHGFDNTIDVEPPSKNVGFIFRKGKDKVILLWGLGSRLEGTFNAERTGGSLEEKPFGQLKAWKKQYASLELR